MKMYRAVYEFFGKDEKSNEPLRDVALYFIMPELAMETLKVTYSNRKQLLFNKKNRFNACMYDPNDDLVECCVTITEIEILERVIHL